MKVRNLILPKLGWRSLSKLDPASFLFLFFRVTGLSGKFLIRRELPRAAHLTTLLMNLGLWDRLGEWEGWTLVGDSLGVIQCESFHGFLLEALLGTFDLFHSRLSCDMAVFFLSSRDVRPQEKLTFSMTSCLFNGV